jgi:hypothetical protein
VFRSGIRLYERWQMFILFILRSVEDFIFRVGSLGVSEIVGFLHSFGGASIHWVFSFYLVVGILISVGVCNDGGRFTFVYGRFYLLWANSSL